MYLLWCKMHHKRYIGIFWYYSQNKTAPGTFLLIRYSPVFVLGNQFCPTITDSVLFGKNSEKFPQILHLQYKSRRDKINEILENEEGIAMAGQVLMKVSRDEEERARIMRDEKIELDYQSGMVTAQRIGFKEGQKEGIEKIARNALAKGYPVNDIIEITGLDLETIKKLSEE